MLDMLFETTGYQKSTAHDGTVTYVPVRRYIGSAVAPMTSDGTLQVATCDCGWTVFASESVANNAQPSGEFKCARCHTFSTDHAFAWSNSDPDDAGRCGICDIRSYSHR